ncbi:MAG: MFS transporter [Microbacteriaceae bacterium]|nr:MFS transporter [Microbacteriaceae bacterium]
MSTTSVPVTTSSTRVMNHAQVIQALIALMAAFFVLILSSTVVATSLPVIITDLGGTQSDYTWIVTANFLTMAISTPIWGKLADIFDRKLLIQLSLGVFTIATVAAGFSTTAGFLIGTRFFQGIGVGGMMALGMVAIADLVSPRERGRYMGIMGAIMGLAQIGGPLLGGVVTDGLGWQWNFFLPVPVAVVAFALIQARMHLPRHRRDVRIDYLGAILLSVSMGLILVWMSLGGKDAASGGFPWDSAESILMIGVGGALVVALVLWELFGTKEPIVPLRLFAQRTFALATVASISVGVTMFGATVFLSQYLQLARGLTPTESGLFTIPMVVGSLLSSLVFGQLITRTGKWKGLVVLAAVVLVAGLALFGTIHFDTSMWLVGLYMAMLGIGTGGLLQNLVLVVQNQLPAKQMGAGTGAVTFFRSLGGTVGIAVLGSILGTSVKDRIATGLKGIGIDTSAASSLGSGASVSDADPEQLRSILGLVHDGTLRPLADAAAADPKVVDALGALSSLSASGGSGAADPAQLEQLFGLIATNPAAAAQALPGVDIEALAPLAQAVQNDPNVLSSFGALSELGGASGAAAGGSFDPEQLRSLLDTIHSGSLDQLAALVQQNPDCIDTLGTLGSGTLPHMADLCEPIRNVMESSYGDSIANLFWYCVPLAVITFVAVLFLPNKPLGRKTAAQQLEEELGAELVALEPIDAEGDVAPVEGGPALDEPAVVGAPAADAGTGRVTRIGQNDGHDDSGARA